MAQRLRGKQDEGEITQAFFWPIIIKGEEEYVKSCEPCQVVRKVGDQKRVPLQLVLIITEVFSKLNVDLVGPLPPSDAGNKYLLTTLCMSSRYPAAVPIKNIKSETVIDALLIIFSRTGLPKQVQCDLGTSFVSVLTTTFFNKFGVQVIHSSVRRPPNKSS